MERTLARLARAGWQDFYRGELGRHIADVVRAGGGIMTREDMAAYAPRLEPALETSYRGVRVFSARLPNGGLTCAETLHMLQHLPLPGPAAAMHWHLLAEALKLSWRDRLRYCGDPRAADVPVERLADAAYAAGRCEALRQAPDAIDLAPGPAAQASPGTLHISAGDAEGNLVAVTISHGGWFGSCFAVPGTGIFLGHGMCRFDPRPGLANSVGPAKRPLNNVCPTILRFPDRDAALGVRGGRRIVSVAAELVLRIAEGTGPQEAATFPRLHLEGYEPLEISKRLEGGIQKELRRMGHRLVPAASVAQIANIVERMRDGKLRTGSGMA